MSELAKNSEKIQEVFEKKFGKNFFVPKKF